MLDPRRVGVMMVVVTEGGGGPVEVVPSRHRGRRGGRGRVLVWVAAGRGGGRAATFRVHIKFTTSLFLYSTPESRLLKDFKLIVYAVCL